MKEDFVSEGHKFLASKTYGCHNFCKRSDIIDVLVDGSLIIQVRMRRAAIVFADDSPGQPPLKKMRM